MALKSVWTPASFLLSPRATSSVGIVLYIIPHTASGVQTIGQHARRGENKAKTTSEQGCGHMQKVFDFNISG